MLRELNGRICDYRKMIEYIIIFERSVKVEELFFLPEFFFILFQLLLNFYKSLFPSQQICYSYLFKQFFDKFKIEITMQNYQLHNFDIISKLGNGAYSSVMKVKRKSDQTFYALKKIKLTHLTSKQIQNSLNQIRILASIKSPYIISYRQTFYDQISNSLCIITDLAQKGDLYSKIKEIKKKNQFFPQIQIWHWLIQILYGLNILHNMNIFHRDIKSANILIGKNNQVMLCDLNVSIISKNGFANTQTGTPYYASPQIWNDQVYNNKNDIWSFGCVVYQLCSGKPPFRGKNIDQLSRKIRIGMFDRISSHYSNELFELICQCLQLEPKNRPSTEELLKNKCISKRIGQFPQFKDLHIYSLQQEKLINTIKPPKFYKHFKNVLPKSNYLSNKQRCLSERERKKSQQRSDSKQAQKTIRISYIRCSQNIENINPKYYRQYQIKPQYNRKIKQSIKPKLPLIKKLDKIR